MGDVAGVLGWEEGQEIRLEYIIFEMLVRHQVEMSNRLGGYSQFRDKVWEYAFGSSI